MSINYEETKVKKKRLHTVAGFNRSIFHILAKMQKLQKYRYIPFAAVKLNVCLQNISKKEIDEIIKDNFRSEKDLIFKGEYLNCLQLPKTESLKINQMINVVV